MADVWVLLLIAAFFAACVALVRGCDLIIGSDDAVDVGGREPVDVEVEEAEAVGAGR